MTPRAWVTVDAERCVSAGNCARLAPRIFGQDARHGTAEVLAAPDRWPDVDVQAAVAACPVGALAAGGPATSAPSARDELERPEADEDPRA